MMRRALIIALVTMLLLTGGFFGWRWMRAGDAENPLGDTLGRDDGGEEEREEEEEEQHLYDLAPIVTDLLPRETGQRSVVRVDLQLRCRDAEAQRRVQEHSVYVRDEVLGILRGTRPEELEGESGMETLRKRIVERVNGILTEEDIIDIYFTEMMVQ